MLDRIRKLIAADSAGKAAALRAALSELDVDAADAAVADAEAARRAALLEGSDAEVVKAEEHIASAKRDRDRMMAARDELERRLAEAELREHEEAWGRERQAVEAEADEAARQLLAVYPQAARRIISVLQRVTEAQAKVEAFNRKLINAQRPGPFVQDVEPRAWKEVQDWRNGERYRAAVITSLRWSDGQPGYGRGEHLRMFS
ncbi:MAG: hypothetical protein E5X34_29790 [Mesorhizobium sp.]|uniref:hypothetical protein n=1 Tax=Mesorhizobium sp. TaxID=1871066 RepID=UPI00120B58B1|nr:hypothetical protein [Mesorhizobium sp.]TIR15288.1 MAG: hypothetical protein E5X34_29790 [Mesorhizobium sp.]